MYTITKYIIDSIKRIELSTNLSPNIFLNKSLYTLFFEIITYQTYPEPKETKPGIFLISNSS